MSFKTYGQIRQKVERDLDLEDEEFVQDEEMLGYCNDAIKAAESLILKLCEDYFLTTETVDLIASQQGYDLPVDIFAHKLRKVLYTNGQDIYVVRRMRLKDDLEGISRLAQEGNTGQRLRYMLTNDADDGVKMNFYPLPNVSGTYIQLWYLRVANTVLDDEDIVDIPEFYGFIEEYMKMCCYEKESNPKYQAAVQKVAAQKALMEQTLANRFPDDDTEIEPDLSHYEEHI